QDWARCRARLPPRPRRSTSNDLGAALQAAAAHLCAPTSTLDVPHHARATRYHRRMADPPLTPIELGLTAAIVTVEGDEPAILIGGDGGIPAGLPFGPFDPLAHGTFEIGLRAFVAAQTGLAVGYVEQLYTFGDRGRHARPGDVAPHVVSVGYLALTRMPDSVAPRAGFAPWYRFFPWEDWR